MSSDEKRSESKRDFVSGFRGLIQRHYFGPKLTSGLFAAIFGGIFTFAPKLQGHSILGPLAKSVLFNKSALFVSIGSAFLFLVAWVKERSQDAAAEFLVSDEGLFRSFSNFCHSGAFYSVEEDEASQTYKFTRRDYVRFLINGEPKFIRLFVRWGKYKRRPQLPWELHLNSTLAERLADLHLERLRKRNVITLLPSVDIDDSYSIDSELVARFQRIRYE